MSEQPKEIKLHQQSRMLESFFDDGSTFQLPCEYLRVYSPSAEVAGHGPTYFWEMARSSKGRQEFRNAWFYHLTARALLRHVPLMSNQPLEQQW